MGEWLLQHIESDETSCCYLADGAESQQVDYLGQLLSRRVNGKLEIKALSLDALKGKSADDQAAAFRTFEVEAIVGTRISAGPKAQTRASGTLKVPSSIGSSGKGMLRRLQRGSLKAI